MQRKTPTLSEALSAIRAGLNKEATEEILADPTLSENEGTIEPEVDPEMLASKADELADKAVEEAAANVTEATEAKDAAVEALKQVARTAAENSETLMAKEASEFGKLFAHAFMNELEKEAAEDAELSKIASEAYKATMHFMEDQAIHSVVKEAAYLTQEYLDTTPQEKMASDEFGMDDLAGVAKEAYDRTLQWVNTQG